MLQGLISTKDYDGWQIDWEHLDSYRFWCKQSHPSNSKVAAIVMLNPGSLSGNGANLSKDTTLRILRELFKETSYNPFIINLFNLATPKPNILFERWEERDHKEFHITSLPQKEFAAVMYAYGDYENRKNYSLDIKERISEIQTYLSDIPEIVVPKNKSGTPKHPIPIQHQSLMGVFREAIINHALANRTLNAECGNSPATG